MLSRFIFIFSLILFLNQVKAQYSASYISYEYSEILVYSISVTYTSESYVPYTRSSFYQNSLAMSQAKYDRNHDIVSTEYGRLLNLELINISNKSILNKFKTIIMQEIEVKSSYADFSKESVTQEYLEFISQPFNIQSIKNEIKLLQKCENEIRRLKNKFPESYTTTKRYQAIAMLLKDLENCNTSEINSLNWEKYEVYDNFQSNKPETNSKKSLVELQNELLGKSNNYNKHGNVSFWQHSSDKFSTTTITINNLTKTIENDLTNISGPNSCTGNNYCANFTLPVGTWNYIAKESNGSTWNGVITIEVNGCLKMRLSRY